MVILYPYQFGDKKMSPSIQISQGTFERLQKLAIPLVDDTESVITRLLDSYVNGSVKQPPRPPSAARRFDPQRAPNLTHTTVTSAWVGGHQVAPATWNRILDVCLERAMGVTGAVVEIRKITFVNIVDGRKEDKGYHFLPAAGLSVQGQDANSAWRASVQLAQRLNLALNVSFYWQAKQGAEHPGEVAEMDLP